jgi:hypothetical protein
MSESVAMSALYDGDLAGLLAWITDTGRFDETETFDLDEGPATIIRIGRSNIRQTGPGRIDLHVHDTVEEARTCYQHSVRILSQANEPVDDPLAGLMAALGVQIQRVDL